MWLRIRLTVTKWLLRIDHVLNRLITGETAPTRTAWKEQFNGLDYTGLVEFSTRSDEKLMCARLLDLGDEKSTVGSGRTKAEAISCALVNRDFRKTSQ